LVSGISMSDEFIVVATKEINDDIAGIKNILDSCTNDQSIFQNSPSLQKYTHKIKGLAPMMGKEELGNLASLLDKILKQTIEGKSFEGILHILTESLHNMKLSMAESDCDLNPIIGEIQQFSSNSS